MRVYVVYIFDDAAIADHEAFLDELGDLMVSQHGRPGPDENVRSVITASHNEMLDVLSDEQLVQVMTSGSYRVLFPGGVEGGDDGAEDDQRDDPGDPGNEGPAGEAGGAP